MKQRLLILATGVAVAFAACNGGNNEGSYSQAQLDSISKAKTDSVAAALKAQNDSTIAAQAQKTADSLRVADSLFNAGKKNGTATVVKKNTKPTKPTTKPPVKEEPKKEEPKTIGNGKPKMGNQNDANTIGNGKPKMGDKKDANTIGNGKPKMGDKRTDENK